MNLRHWSRPCFTGLTLLCLFSLFAVAEEDEKIAWIEGRFFDVIGTDHRSVSFASVLGENIAELCQRRLKVGSHEFPTRILVTLYTKERSDLRKKHQIQVSSRGQIGLNFRWDESLSFENVCFAFTEAYMMHYARFNYGVGADERLRFWPLSALSSRNYISLRPAQKTNLIRMARASEIPEIESLFSASLTDVTDKGLDLHQGYWVFQALRESGLKKSQLAELLELAIAGVDIADQVSEMLLSADKENQSVLLEEWWQSWLGGYLSQKHEFYDTLSTSSLWIEEMTNFDAYRANGGTLKDLMELWTYRRDEALRLILNARCEIIRLRIEQVNPAYFNATLSLGALYETILEAENKHEFISSVLFFLNDWEDTKRLHSRVDKLTAECRE